MKISSNKILRLFQNDTRHEKSGGSVLKNSLNVLRPRKGKLGANAVKRVAADAHLPTPWLFEPAKRPDDRADCCLDCSFLSRWKHQVLVFTLEWSGARPMGEQW